ncbi:MAG: flagellin [Verrucomicrobia bacterium GWF2_51_19]|nr:MAG: flagellin [Verrucomicrobia bacterium GWF2_51_19]HCJ12428.1 flagellin [Opitutae bacterium]
MALVINTNTTASLASAQLNSTNALLQKSINRLSSGRKIIEPSDDAGGLAVSVKLESIIKRTSAVQNNVSNATSFLQTQDGAMDTVGKILNRVSELKMLYTDVTKSTSDKANYDKEFTQLKAQLGNLEAEKFNGVSVFSSSSVGEVIISEDGTQKITLSAADMSSKLTSVTNASSLNDLAIATITTAIGEVAGLRAQNGAQSSRLAFAGDMLTINKTNIEAANSRIVDTDVAAESTSFAKFNILSNSGAAMLAQANTISQVALRLIGG